MQSVTNAMSSVGKMLCDGGKAIAGYVDGFESRFVQNHTDATLPYDINQVKLMKEECIVIDKDDNVVRSGSKEECHLMENINKGLLHRAFSVFLFNSEGKLLLQQRSSAKITFPSLWTNTCCSHPLFTENELGWDLKEAVAGSKRAAVRKLNQELGIDTSSINLEDLVFLGRIHYCAPSNGHWGEHEIDYIFFLQADVKLDINQNEVCEFKYVDANELKQMLGDPRT